MIGRYCLHPAGIVNKLTGIFVLFFWGGGRLLCFYYNTIRRKRPLEEKYELVAHERSMSC